MKHRSFAVLLLAALGGCAPQQTRVDYSPPAIVETPPTVSTILSCEQLSMEETALAAAGDPGVSAEQRLALEERSSALRSVAAAKGCRTS